MDLSNEGTGIKKKHSVSGDTGKEKKCGSTLNAMSVVLGGNNHKDQNWEEPLYIIGKSWSR